LGKPGFARLDRQPAQVLDVELQQIEGAKHGLVASQISLCQVTYR
jgi:hypothetical protein